MNRPSLDWINAMIRDSIERQVATTPAGQALTEYNAQLVKSLVRNIVGNLATAVDEMVYNMTGVES